MTLPNVCTMTSDLMRKLVHAILNAAKVDAVFKK